MALHPELAPLMEMMAAAGLPPIETLDPSAARAMTAAMGANTPPGPVISHVEEITLPTRDGSIGARLYRPQTPATGLMVYFHGGGWVLGTLDSCDGLCRALADRSGIALLSVDYRLAPENPFPAAANDAIDALIWASGDVERLAGAKVPLTVSGDSAGGNLAIVAALAARDAGVALTHQLLFYPVTDAACDTPSYAENEEAPVLTARLMRWFWDHYVQQAHDRADWRASPLRAENLAGLPPAFIQTAELDPLRDEAELFGARLAAAGVDVTVDRIHGFVHGYANMYPFVPAASAALDRAVADVKRHISSAA